MTFKNIFCNCLLILIITSCSKEERTILGAYQLVEMTNGQWGSADFSPVESDRIIEFRRKGKIWSNGLLCNYDTSAVNESVGEYFITDSSIVVNGCMAIFEFTLTDGEIIITYPFASLGGSLKIKYRKI
ncbi:MAG: hypothetical protein AB8B72_04530 [Crocinitomicaceae bacterium]